MRNNDAINKYRESIAAAIKSGDMDKFFDALEAYGEEIQNGILEEVSAGSNQDVILAARGVRVLTEDEKKFYDKLAKAMLSDNPKAAITNLGVAMPETIIDSVMEDVATEFELLSAIDFVNTTALTKWIINAQGVQQAVWGKLGTGITEELDGSLKTVNTEMYKLTAFMAVSKDFLRLGPAWLDRYVRSILVEATGIAAEVAVVSGDGSNCPIGMVRDLSKGATNDGVTTYPKKDAIAVTELTPKAYGELLAPLAETETGRMRKIEDVILVVNPKDYMLKIMPATTILTPQGTYVNNVLPYPTKVIQSVAVDDNEAVLGLGKKYFLGLGSQKEGFIEYDDSVQFLDDNRVYSSHLYGSGKPKDNKAFQRLDISGLKPMIYTLQAVEVAEE